MILGEQIRKASKITDDKRGEINAPDQEKGYMLCVTKSQAPGAERPSYTVRARPSPAPLAQILETTSEEEKAALVPLEQTLATLSDEEQWQRLATALPPDLVATVRREKARRK